MGGNDGKDGADPSSGSDLDARLKRLSRDLGQQASQAQATRSDPDPAAIEEMARARSAGLRILGEFVAAVIAGVVIGYFVDQVAGTSPAFLVVFLFLGTAAGFLNIYRLAAPRKDRGGGTAPRG